MNDLVFKRNLAIRSVLSLEQRQVINDYVRAWLGIAPAEPVAVFPQNLVGTDANTTLANLEAEGWEVVFSTPGEIGMNRDSEALNLGISRNGEIISAELLN
ncbi:MAG: hypothetical protein HC929_02150 [Leptolyngbyaceae cyanobacterium SM2_5_2]|nr:hypothetical protein [Leptolyngbyaceae cyanobacterium SM2_5_2]